MALSRDHLMAIFVGCNKLERFVLNCDIWCDSPLDDQLIYFMRQSCPSLSHLDLCPGNFQTTDESLHLFASFSQLRYIRIVEFNGVTEIGLMHLVQRTATLRKCIVEDCCDINPDKMISFVKSLYYGTELISTVVNAIRLFIINQLIIVLQRIQIVI